MADTAKKDDGDTEIVVAVMNAKLPCGQYVFEAVDKAEVRAIIAAAKPMIERELLRNMMEWNETHRKLGSELIDIDAFAKEQKLTVEKLDALEKHNEGRDGGSFMNEWNANPMSMSEFRRLCAAARKGIEQQQIEDETDQSGIYAAPPLEPSGERHLTPTEQLGNAVAHMEASHASGVIEGGFWADGEYIRGSISVDDLTTPTEGADSVSRRADLNCEPSGEPLQNGLKPEPSPSLEKGMV